MAAKKTAGSAKTVSGKTLAPATKMAASGALIEPAIVDGIDTTHPAVDDNPREGTTADMNRIYFNDPTKSQDEAVADNLKEG